MWRGSTYVLDFQFTPVFSRPYYSPGEHPSYGSSELWCGNSSSLSLPLTAPLTSSHFSCFPQSLTSHTSHNPALPIVFLLVFLPRFYFPGYQSQLLFDINGPMSGLTNDSTLVKSISGLPWVAVGQTPSLRGKNSILESGPPG